MADLQVVTVAFNPGPELDAMLASLDQAGPGIETTIHIVDNGTETATVDEVARRYGATVHRTGANLGYGRGANIALLAPDAPWSLLLNPDTVLEPGSITALLEATRRWKKGGVFGPMILDESGEVYPSARELPGFSTGIGHALLGRIWPSNPWTSAYHGSVSEEQSTGWLSGAALLIRPEAFAQIGGFSDDYFMFFEDVDLARRLSVAGWQSVYVPSARITHEQGVSWKERPEPMIKAHHRSAAAYLKSAYPSLAYAPLRWATSAGLALRARIVSR